MRIGKRTFASRKRNIAGLCAFVLAGVIGVGAYAFTASNTVPAQAAGGGTNAVSGYTETGVSYTWSLTGEFITEAHIVLTGVEKLEPSDVAVALSKEEKPGAGEWVDCPSTGYTKISVTETEVVCKFKGGEGAWENATTPATNKFATNGVPNVQGKTPDEEGIQLSISAVSEGKVIIEP
jgi:hypothetical protein